MLLRHVYDDELGLTKKMQSLGPKIVAVTDGKRGASVVSESGWIKMEAYKVHSVDDTGAGDAFCAGFITGIIENKELETALKMGLANGASEVTKIGAKNGLLYKKEMEKWLRKRLKTVEEQI